MATDNTAAKFPKVKFRWCRTVHCISKEVYFILTSISGAIITLSWKDDLGWYESEYISLPVGLYSGYLQIREKIKYYVLSPFHQESEVKDREYNVDPFFVTPTRHGIQLFINSNNSQGSWTDNSNLHQRYFSSHALGIHAKQREREELLKRFSPRKWSSSYELRNSSDEGKAESFQGPHKRPQDVVEAPVLQTTCDGKVKTECRKKGEPAVFRDKQEEPPSLPFSTSNLRKWGSVGHKGESSFKTSSSETSFYANSHSFHSASDSNEEIKESHVRATRDTGKVVADHVVAGDSNTREEEVHKKFYSSFETGSQNKIVLSQSKITEIQRREISSEHKVKYIFREVDPHGESNEGYRCLITFESRSSSMDDLGSPSALEDVLVSLTSTDTDGKYPCHTAEGASLPKEAQKNLSEVIKLSEKSGAVFRVSETNVKSQGDLQYVCEFSGADKSDSKCHESDITINEDENFEYDSIRNDDETIPLNICDVLDSDNSLEYSVNVNVKLARNHKPSASEFDVFHAGLSQDVVETVLDTSDNICKKDLTGDRGSEPEESPPSTSKESERCHSAVDGAAGISPLILVDPGSLRSDTDNGESGTFAETLVESDNSPSEVELFRAVKKIKQLSKSLKPTGKPSHQSPIKFGKLSPHLKTKVVIVQNKKPVTVNSTGTQTSHREIYEMSLENFSALRTKRKQEQRSPQSSTLYKEKYTPLPSKVQGPWSSKFTGKPSRADRNEQYRDSVIKKFHQNYNNLVRAEQILRQINPTSDSSDTDVAPYARLKVPRVRKLPLSRYSLSDIRDAKYSEWPLPPPPSLQRPPTSKFITGTLKPSVSFVTPPTATKISLLQPEYQGRGYGSPTRLKQTPKALFSVYGREALNTYARSAPGSKYLQPDFRSFHSSSVMRPANSLPDLRRNYEETGYSDARFPQSYLTRPAVRAVSALPSHNSRRLQRLKPEKADFYRKFRGRSFDSDLMSSESSSGGSTDSLLDEAIYFTTARALGTDEGNYGARPAGRSSYRRRRSRARSLGYTDEDVKEVRSPRTLLSPRQSIMEENHVSSMLRARSEIDLRMVGSFSGGFKGSRPYLPYSKEELSVGQVVKVLVPGEGVAMARIVYSPANDHMLPPKFSQTVSVLLISEPTSLSGSVITIPMSKILLAWPKTSFL